MSAFLTKIVLPFSVRLSNPEGGSTTCILNAASTASHPPTERHVPKYVSPRFIAVFAAPPPQWAPVTTILNIFLMFLMRATRLANLLLFDFITVTIFGGRSQWPRGLRRRSAAARLLGMRARIPLRAWIIVCCECCVLSGRGLCDGLITRPEESY